VIIDGKGNRHPRLLLSINERSTGRSKDLIILKLKVTVPRQTIQHLIPLAARSGGITAIVPIKYLSEILESLQIKTAIGLRAPN
jgi:hypothetical protein